MLSIHPQARTTPAVRQEIARSSECESALTVDPSRWDCKALI
jgi:hypothetical protein